VRVGLDLRDPARMVRDDLARLAVRRLRRARSMAAERLQRQPDERGDDDQGEERATEEAVHKASRRRVPAGLVLQPEFARKGYAPSGSSDSSKTPTKGRFRYRSAKSRP